MKIVLDTNVLLKSLPKKSQYRLIFDAIKQGKVSLLLTTAILLEYVEIVGAKTNEVIANNVGNLIVKLGRTEQIVVHTRWRLIETDPDDNKFVDCAIAGGADYIVTDDRHFAILQEIDFPKVTVIGSAAFADLLLKGDNF